MILWVVALWAILCGLRAIAGGERGHDRRPFVWRQCPQHFDQLCRAGAECAVFCAVAGHYPLFFQGF